MLESELLEAQNERERSSRQAKNAKERLAEMEKDRKDLADEYVVLKTNYLALVREHEKEVQAFIYQCKSISALKRVFKTIISGKF